MKIEVEVTALQRSSTRPGAYLSMMIEKPGALNMTATVKFAAEFWALVILTC